MRAAGGQDREPGRELTTTKQAQDALLDCWDREADRARDEFIRIAAPALAKLYRARYHSNNPIAVGNLLRSTGILSDLEALAEQTEVVYDVNLPTSIESSILTHEQRSTGLQRDRAA